MKKTIYKLLFLKNDMQIKYYKNKLKNIFCTKIMHGVIVICNNIKWKQQRY